MASEAAQQLMAETGAAVYWQGQEEAQARIEADRAKSAEINEILGR